MSGRDFELSALAAPEAEAGIIGALLLEPDAMDRIADIVQQADFFDQVNAEVFGEIARQFMAGKPADVITVYEGLGGRVGLPELHAMAQYVPSAANLRRYAETVRERAMSRRLLSIAGQIEVLAVDHEMAVEERVERAQGELMKLVAERARDEWVSVQDGMVDHLDLIQDRADGKTNAMPTGLVDLDRILGGGLRPGQLVIVGARPSMGKTALGMTIGLNMAEDYSVGMLSMEMPHTEVRDRMLANLGRLSLSWVQRPDQGDNSAENWSRLTECVERSRLLNFHVSDQGGLNINQVRSKARSLKRRHGLNVLVVDYIGLMSGLDQKQQRAYQLEEISRGLKTLAKELDIAVVCLAQVNRKVEERADQTPSLSDLRDSGAIEQDADIVMFIHRPIQARPDMGQEFEHYAKLAVAKNRNGRCGVLNLYYQGDQTRFAAWRGEAPVGRSARPRGAL